MVMHARKTQRISDGYFEKHQTHPYQNSKYGSSKANYGERYNHERIRNSPNGNSCRSDSPDSESPRERSYQNKMYVQKIREKERDRDYKSREKYSDCSRSPKEKRSRESRDSEHRTNHDRIIEEKEKEKDKVARVGDWTEHMSSSGKKYYYNCKTEVSQWEKPKEWIDREKERGRYKEKEREREKEREVERCYTGGSRLGHEKHSNARASNSSMRESSRQTRQPEKGTREEWNREQTKDADRLEQSHERRRVVEGEVVSQDMDISPGESTPTSETGHSGGAVVTADPPAAPILLANALPRLVSHPSTDSTPQTAVTTCNVPGPPATPGVAPAVPVLQPLQVDTSCQAVTAAEGPPTPTHSETHDGVDARKMTSPPNSSCALQGVTSYTQAAQGAGGGSSLQALRQQGPHLTPSLANYLREDLVGHVCGWPADSMEKQSQKLSEEAHVMTSLQCTRVSAELKTARSIVRLTEIQATLQEQRILFLRQQIKTLEELNTQHSFMGDDS